MTRFVVGVGILASSVAVAVWLTRGSPLRSSPVTTPRGAVTLPRAAATTTGAVSSALALERPEAVLPEAHPWSHALCPSDMVWVGGKFCPRPRSERGDDSRCVVGERSVAVCMDPHEYPSQPGTLPAVMLDFKSASEACKAEGKRPCTETEWTFACESTRDVAACNTGRTALSIRTQELAKADRVSVEIAAHEGRRESGENGCVNAFRVFDQLGNVQEWVTSEHRTPHVGALKGGRYNQSSIGCGRSIYVSDPWTRYPHTGVRCCADPLASAPTSP